MHFITKVCRVCLSTDSKLYDMKQYNLDEPYEKITGINVTGETYPDMLCVECAQRLLNCVRFRDKCIRGHILLTKIWDTYGGLTAQSVKSVDCHQNGLVSQLQVKHIEADHCDLYCEHTDYTDTHRDEMAIEDIDEMKIDDNVFGFEIKRDFDYDVAIEDVVETKNEVDADDDDDFSLMEVKCNTNVAPAVEVGIQDVNSAAERKNDESQAPKESGYKTKRLRLVKKVPNTKSGCKSKRMKSKSVKKVCLDSETSNLSMETECLEKELKKALKDVESQPEVYCKNFTWTSKDINDVDVNDKVFTITKITFEEQMEEIKMRKEGANYKYAKFKCEVCFKGFIDDLAFDNHMITHTKKCGDSHCDICKTYYKNPYKLKWHMKCFHTCRFTCNKCPYVTRLQSAAKKHVLFHKGVKYKCTECSMEFTKPTTYFSHRRLKHSCDFVCEMCGYSFLSERGVHFHKNKQHKFEKAEITSDSPLCETCNIRFYSVDALRTHMAVHKHKSSDNINRVVKNTKYNQRDYSHKWVKVATSPIPCEQCGVVLDTPRAYFFHFKRSHPGMTRTVYNSAAMHSPNMCEVCGKMFQKPCHLKDHKFAHTGEKKFKCDQCDKSFMSKIHLNNHKKTHSVNRQLYDCPTCGKQFTNYSNRSRHMMSHKGDKAFHCSECGKSFTTNHSMHSHHKHVHLKEPWPKRTRVRRDVPRAADY